jgi:hypothetical protein
MMFYLSNTVVSGRLNVVKDPKKNKSSCWFLEKVDIREAPPTFNRPDPTVGQ